MPWIYAMGLLSAQDVGPSRPMLSGPWPKDAPHRPPRPDATLCPVGGRACTLVLAPPGLFVRLQPRPLALVGSERAFPSLTC
eukprot:12187071-Alexandrium_andersonii.AAC.1